jgi:CspA family cold shock protein
MNPITATVAAALLLTACDETPPSASLRSATTVAESTAILHSATTVTESTLIQPAVAEVSVTGSVKWFDNAKGYGFLTPDDSTADVFVHYSTIQVDGFKSLKQGQRVRFVIRAGPKGRQATEVQPLPARSPK